VSAAQLFVGLRYSTAYALRRVGIALAAGVAATAVVAQVSPLLQAVLVGWDVSAAVFLGMTWSTDIGLDSSKTRALAEREDPSSALAGLVIVTAGVACLGAVALTFFGSHGGASGWAIGIGALSVMLSWFALHTVFTFRYARLYYAGDDGGIDFNGADDDEPPTYMDFAYVAFTIGMTFQVSDTNLTAREIRRTALSHALLSYLFGAVIIGLMINAIAGLAH
jgi:uncharacterized membrane protein